MTKKALAYDLLTSRRFAPMFFTQFLGAFNDNLFKSALVTLITYELKQFHGISSGVLVTIVAGLFILPFFLFSSLAGEISDKFEKSFVVKMTKLTELILMILTAICFVKLNIFLLIILLFFMGAQSTFFGPLKYSVIPELLAEHELVTGNALVNASTNVAILLGTICGGLLIMTQHGRGLVSVGIVVVAALGLFASCYVPHISPSSPELTIRTNIFTGTTEMLKFPFTLPKISTIILCISWFWCIGSVFLAQFVTFAKEFACANNQVSTFFLVLFSVGVAFGAFCCNKILKGKISARLATPSLIAMTISSILLYTVSSFFRANTGTELCGLVEFLTHGRSILVCLLLFSIALFGGMFSVPLYALLQNKMPRSHGARVIASLNVTDSLGMVLTAAISTLLLALGISVPGLFLIFGLLNLPVILLVKKL